MNTISFQNVRDYYDRNQPDGHWFDAGSMKFFKTKLPDVAYETAAGILFITSEVNPSGVKAYSIRRQHVDGSIKTVGEFHSYRTSASALKAIKALHNGQAVEA